MEKQYTHEEMLRLCDEAREQMKPALLKWVDCVNGKVDMKCNGGGALYDAVRETRKALGWEMVMATVPDEMTAHEANERYGECYGVDWKYPNEKMCSPE